MHVEVPETDEELQRLVDNYVCRMCKAEERLSVLAGNYERMDAGLEEAVRKLTVIDAAVERLSSGRWVKECASGTQ